MRDLRLVRVYYCANKRTSLTGFVMLARLCYKLERWGEWLFSGGVEVSSIGTDAVSEADLKLSPNISVNPPGEYDIREKQGLHRGEYTSVLVMVGETVIVVETMRLMG